MVLSGEQNDTMCENVASTPAPYPRRGHQFTIKGERERDRSAFGMRASIIPRGERENASALNEEIYGPVGARCDDRFMPTRIGSSGSRRTDGRMAGSLV